MVERLVEICLEDKPDVFHEALWALCNCTENCKPEMFQQLVSRGILSALFHRAEELESRNLQVMLIGVRNILTAGEAFYRDSEGNNSFAMQIVQANYLDKIEALESHKSSVVYSLAEELLQFFVDIGGETPCVDDEEPQDQFIV